MAAKKEDAVDAGPMTEVEKAAHNEEVAGGGAVVESAPVNRASRKRHVTGEERGHQPHGTVNPDEEHDIDLSNVPGTEHGDDGLIVGNWVGVSADRMFKPADVHAYPMWSEDEIKAEEDREAEIAGFHEAAEKARSEDQKRQDAAANKRLRDLINGA